MLPTIRLPSGANVPVLAFGSGTAWFYRQSGELNRELVDIMKAALRAGLRHIDTAEIYGTEGEVGAALTEYLAEPGSVPRSDLFVTSKVFAGFRDPVAAIKAGLKKCQISYFDLYLLHAPFLEQAATAEAKQKQAASGGSGGATSTATVQPLPTLTEVWRGLEAAVEAGLVKDIGVSNFGVKHLKELLPHAKIRPAVNQVEFNPCLAQPALQDYCKQHGITMASYGPLTPLTSILSPPPPPTTGQQAPKPASHPPHDPAAVEALKKALEGPAQRAGKTTADVLLKWNLSKGNIVVTTTSNPDRIKTWLALPQFELTAQEIAAIDAAGAKLPFRKFWTNVSFD